MQSHSNMNGKMRTLKKKSTSQIALVKHLLLLAGALFVFALGLSVGRLQSGAVPLLLVVVGVVGVALLAECFYLWRRAVLFSASSKRRVQKGVTR